MFLLRYYIREKSGQRHNSAQLFLERQQCRCADIVFLFYHATVKTAGKEDIAHSDPNSYKQYLFYPVTSSDASKSWGTGIASAHLDFYSYVVEFLGENQESFCWFSSVLSLALSAVQ